MAKIYDFKAQTSKGKELDFAQFEGKVLLVVNTASKCGFTPPVCRTGGTESEVQGQGIGDNRIPLQPV